jgi:hypothetical protein
MTMNDELEKILRDMVVTYFKSLQSIIMCEQMKQSKCDSHVS